MSLSPTTPASLPDSSTTGTDRTFCSRIRSASAWMESLTPTAIGRLRSRSLTVATRLSISAGRGHAEPFEHEGRLVVQLAGAHRREDVPLVRDVLEVGIGDGRADRIRVRRGVADDIDVLDAIGAHRCIFAPFRFLNRRIYRTLSRGIGRQKLDNKDSHVKLMNLSALSAVSPRLNRFHKDLSSTDYADLKIENKHS